MEKQDVAYIGQAVALEGEILKDALKELLYNSFEAGP